jgi:hypothetical protein
MTDVVALPEAVESGAVDPEKPQSTVEHRQFVQIDQEVKDPVEELMPLRRQTPVKDGTLVEAGAKRGIHGNHFIGRHYTGVALTRIEDIGMTSFLEFMSS